mgnify:CR=1 FL=1
MSPQTTARAGAQAARAQGVRALQRAETDGADARHGFVFPFLFAGIGGGGLERRGTGLCEDDDVVVVRVVQRQARARVIRALTASFLHIFTYFSQNCLNLKGPKSLATISNE